LFQDRMIELLLIGVGSGNPDHLTLEAIKALRAAEIILIPLKGADKSDLADVRRKMVAEFATNPATRVVEFQLPRRDVGHPDYLAGVEEWHANIAAAWQQEIASHSGSSGRVALLVWGDPSLYDSTLRIAARLSEKLPVKVRVIPGITSLQALTASHRMPLNDIGGSVLITTGRQLRDHGWPEGIDTLAVMLDGETSFQHLASKDVSIWWGAFLGLPEEIILSGPLENTGPRIVAARSEARAQQGWIMDIYILRRAFRQQGDD
jgi:precorrin-6A synthase